MKRFLGLKKKKVKNDSDLSYRPPSADHADTINNNNNLPPPPSAGGGAADHGSSSDTGQSDITSGYRYALTAFADTIDPAYSNEDGMGGGGGTLRSRSGRVRGSAGLKHRGSLIPVFEDKQYINNNNNNVSPQSRGGIVAGNYNNNNVSTSPTTSSATTGTALRQERYDAYERIMQGGTVASIEERPQQRHRHGGTNNNASSSSSSWAPVPEQPRDDNIDSHGTNTTQGNNINDQQQQQQLQQQSTSNSNKSNASFRTGSLMDEVMNRRDDQDHSDTAVPSLDFSNAQQRHQRRSQGTENAILQSTTNNRAGNEEDDDDDPNNNTNTINLDVITQSLSANTMSTSSQIYAANTYLHNSHTNTMSSTSTSHEIKQAAAAIPSKEEIILQPDAIYEEHYGDAYIDQLIKYLYPAGYQSMRPRSGPWKLSIFIFLLFLWLSVFIVGHCYDRGQREYNDYFTNADDEYLQEVDDDALVMETRWCGSKPLYFMWLVCVWVTVVSMSYCSIIGYVKIRDVAVANGRSQPSGMFGGSVVGRSDYYVMVENAIGETTTAAESSSTSQPIDNAGGDATSEVSSAAYSSYQGGSNIRRYAPSIYQSDGTPQFWGGHIYRPTQAAVAMTNRP